MWKSPGQLSSTLKWARGYGWDKTRRRVMEDQNSSVGDRWQHQHHSHQWRWAPSSFCTAERRRCLLSNEPASHYPPAEHTQLDLCTRAHTAQHQLDLRHRRTHLQTKQTSLQSDLCWRFTASESDCEGIQSKPVQLLTASHQHDCQQQHLYASPAEQRLTAAEKI